MPPWRSPGVSRQHGGVLPGIRSDLLFTIYGALDEAGSAISFPQRDIHLQALDALLAALEGRGNAGRSQPGAARHRGRPLRPSRLHTICTLPARCLHRGHR